MKITFIGTSSGLSVLDRSHASLLVNLDNHKILLDCGEGTTRSLLNQNIDPGEIDRIIISHTHPDHCAGLPILMQYLHLKKITKSLSVFLPDGVGETFQQFFDQLFLLKGKNSFPYEIEEYGAGVVLRYRDICLTALPNRHLTGYQSFAKTHRIALSSFSLIIEFCDKKVYYSADLLDETDLNPPAAADLMIVESTHIPLPIALAKAKTQKIPRIIFTHIGPEITDIASFTQEGINIEYAFDGMELTL